MNEDVSLGRVFWMVLNVGVLSIVAGHLLGWIGAVVYFASGGSVVMEIVVIIIVLLMCILLGRLVDKL
jgi:fructose-specific phosphotransferase system IIC component